ncbi:MAG: fructosamine kinase family protein [Thalassospira sp.]|uniref:fructosamine kinase family protein n=1 Tax=Thalassospira sp. TaxID=1912094 RepID=UPI0032EAAA57
MNTISLNNLVKELTGADISAKSPLGGGSVASVFQIVLDNGRSLVVKQSTDGDTTGGLEIEANMLRHFSQHSPITCPDVLYADPDCLIMDFIANDNRMGNAVQLDLAEQLAAQHNLTADAYGLNFDTLIGGLHQPNNQTPSWVTFFGEHRLRHMTHASLLEGKLSPSMTRRIDHLIDRLGDLIGDTPNASLLHGDLWGGNILCQDGKLAALIDPALYYGDHEIELAFGTLFGDLTPDFFSRYREIIPIAPGFFEERRDLYNLYPLLVHVRLFGGSYIGSVDQILSRFGH